jgi:hypothetical protein
LIADAAPRPFWLDRPDAPAARPSLDGPLEADLVVVGGGLTGLWTALQAAEEGKRVVLLEGERIAFGASGRNGGFCAASLTHGIANGLARWPGEMPAIERMARENLDGTRATIARHEIDCGWEDTGTIDVATEPHQLAWLAAQRAQLRSFGWEAELFDAEAMRAQVDSPTYLGGLWSRRATALLDPARLCWGLARGRGGRRLGLRGLARDRPGARRRGSARGHGGRLGAGAARAAGDERVPAAGARDPPLRRARLGLRARDRAALAGPA